MEAFALSLATRFSTTLGGMLIVWLRGKLARLMAFSAGVSIGVALLDLLPEALKQAAEVHITTQTVVIAAAGGFLFLQLLAQMSLLGTPKSLDHEPMDTVGPSARESDATGVVDREAPRLTRRGGIIAAAGLSIHGLLDGVAIGIAFQTGTAIGVAVAIAVIGHSAADGLNTVRVVPAHGAPKRRSVFWLTVDAVAPVVGALLAFNVAVPTNVLVILLGGFVGFFLYIGASDLLPEARRRDHTPWPTVLFAGGIAFAALVIPILGGL